MVRWGWWEQGFGGLGGGQCVGCWGLKVRWTIKVKAERREGVGERK